MAEVVGTAYVAIRAITNQLAGDIKDAVDKGARDADTDSAGKILSTNLSDSTSKHLKKDAGKAVGDALDDSADSDPVKKGIKGLAQSISNKFKKSFQDSVTKEGKNGIFGDMFTDMGKNLDKAISSMNLPIMWSAILAAAPLAGMAIQAVGAAVITLVGQLGFLITAAAGGGIALAGAFASILPALGLLMFAFKAETDTLKDFQEASKDLGEPWKDVAEIVQKEFLPAVLDSWHLVNDKLIPSFKEYAKGIGPILSNLARFGAETLTSTKNVTALDKILTSSGTVMDNLGRSVVIAITPLLDLLARSQPLAEKLSESIRKMAEHFAAFVELRGDSISTMFDVWYERAATVMRILGNLSIALWNVFKIGANASGDMFTNFEKLTKQWSDFTKSLEGENKIKSIFDEAAPVTKELWGIITDIVKLIVKPVISGDTASLVGFLKTVREEWIPAISTLLGVLKTATTGSFDTVVDSITRFLKVLADNPEVATQIFNILSSNIIIFAKALDVLTTVLDSDLGAKLAPVILQIVFLLQVANTMKVLGPATKLLEGFFQVLSGGEVAASSGMIMRLGGYLGGLVAPLLPVAGVLLAIAAAIAAVTAGFLYADTIIDWIKQFWEWTGKLNPILGTFLRGLALLLVFTNPLAQLAGAGVLVRKAFDNWDEILGKIQGVGEAIKNFVIGLPEMLAGLAGSLGESLAGLFEGFDIGKVADTLFDTLSELPGKISGFLGGVLEKLPGLLSTGINAVIDWLLETFGDLPSKLGEIGTKIFDAIADWFTGLIPKVAPLIGNVIGTIVGFWLGLPFRILGAIPTIVRAFLEFGPQVITGIARVGSSIIFAVVGFIIELPGHILSFLPVIGNAFARIFLAIPGFIMSALDGLIGIIIGVLARLPGLIIAALAGIGSLMLSALSAAFDMVKASMPGYLQNILTFFQELPGKAVDALASLGSMLGGVIQGAASTVWEFLRNMGSEAVSILTSLPGDLAGAIADLGGALGRVISSAATSTWNGITSLVGDAVNAISGLPGRVAGAIGSLGSELGSAIARAAGSVTGAIGGIIEDAVREAGKLPGRIASALSGLAGEVGGAISRGMRSAWNSAVDAIGALSWDGPFGIHIGIPTGWMRLAEGAIIRHPTFAQIGEAGAEAVIPLTQPARALQLMNEAGLSDLVRDNQRKQTPSVEEVTMLKIDKAYFNEKVDADILAQTLMLKYRAAGAL